MSRVTDVLAVRPYLLKLIFWSLAISIGALQAWTNRFNLSSDDAVSYLDIGDAYLAGEWTAAINAYWSPLYSWLVGLATATFQPSMYWEFFVVKIVNLFLLIFYLACFEFFLRQLIHYYRQQVSQDPSSLEIPEWVWVVSGYTLCLWSSLHWMSVYLDSPDMVVAAFVCVAAGLLLRVQVQSSNWLTYITLGVVLGLGYLSKAVMLPLSLVFLAVGMFAAHNRRRAVPRILVALFAFTIVTAPFVTWISISKGRLTFGDTGKLNYTWLVTKSAKPYRYWQGDEPGSGTAVHPPRKIYDEPAVYEFGSPVSGTYPPWYDPSYWYEGLEAKLDLRQLIQVSAKNLKYYSDLFLFVLVFVYLIIIFTGSRPASSAIALVQNWSLLIPAIAGLGVYMIALDMRPSFWSTRYIAPFIVLLFAGVFASVRLIDTQQSQRLVGGLATITAIIITTTLLFWNIAALMSPVKANRLVNQGILDKAGLRSVKAYGQRGNLEIAESLRQLGIEPREKVALLGEFGRKSYWARLMRVKIVAEIPMKPKDFWGMDKRVRSEVLQRIQKSGATIVATTTWSDIPDTQLKKGWQQIASTGHYVYFLHGEAHR